MISPPSTATNPTLESWSTSVNTSICRSEISLTALKYRRYSVFALNRPCMARIASASAGPDGRRCATPPSASRTSASQWSGYTAIGVAVTSGPPGLCPRPGQRALISAVVGRGLVARVVGIQPVRGIDDAASVPDGAVNRHLHRPVPRLEGHRIGHTVGHVDRQRDLRTGRRGPSGDPAADRHVRRCAQSGDLPAVEGGGGG